MAFARFNIKLSVDTAHIQELAQRFDKPWDRVRHKVATGLFLVGKDLQTRVLEYTPQDRGRLKDDLNKGPTIEGSGKFVTISVGFRAKHATMMERGQTAAEMRAQTDLYKRLIPWVRRHITGTVVAPSPTKGIRGGRTGREAQVRRAAFFISRKMKREGWDVDTYQARTGKGKMLSRAWQEKRASIESSVDSLMEKVAAAIVRPKA